MDFRILLFLHIRQNVLNNIKTICLLYKFLHHLFLLTFFTQVPHINFWIRNPNRAYRIVLLHNDATIYNLFERREKNNPYFTNNNRSHPLCQKDRNACLVCRINYLFMDVWTFFNWKNQIDFSNPHNFHFRIFISKLLLWRTIHSHHRTIHEYQRGWRFRPRYPFRWCF